MYEYKKEKKKRYESVNHSNGFLIMHFTDKVQEVYILIHIYYNKLNVLIIFS